MNEKMTQNVSNASADGEIDILEILFCLKSKLKFLLIFLLTATDGQVFLFKTTTLLNTDFVRNMKTLLQKAFVFNKRICVAGYGYSSYMATTAITKNINQ